MGQTPNYSLATFQSQDITQRFLEYRTAIAGDEASSNMYKIDLAMKGLSDQIEALSKRGTIAQINAEYSDVGYFTATSETITDYTNGMVISLSLNQTNQGTVGLNINEIGTVQIVYATPEGQLQDITAGMMKQNSVYFCVYNGTYWVLSSAGYASTSNNVSDTINGKNITNIFETDGTTAKNATLQKQTEKLQTPVSIGLSGVAATAQQFDGSQGITIPITQIPGQLVTDVVMSVNSIEPQSGNIELQATDVNAVATVNGILPSDGNVQLSASDIGAAPSSNGISTYTCTTTGTTHALTGTGNNIKFVADAPFNEGDTITVNGSSVSAYTQDGEALTGGAWNTGMTVVCYLNGTTLNFKGGGGSVTVEGLSADVVLAGNTVTVKQGAKVVRQEKGTYYAGWIGGGGTDNAGNNAGSFIACDIPGVTVTRVSDEAVIPNPGSRTYSPGRNQTAIKCNKSFKAVCYTLGGSFPPKYNGRNLSNGQAFSYVAGRTIELNGLNTACVIRVTSIPG